MKKLILFSALLALSFVSCSFGFGGKKPEIEPLEKIIPDVEYTELDTIETEKWAVWSRNEGCSSSFVSEETVSGKKYETYNFRYTGENDYSITFMNRFEVEPGKCYLACANIRLESGSASLSFVREDKDHNVIEWNASSSSIPVGNDYAAVYCVVVADEETGFLRGRIVGNGVSSLQVMNLVLYKVEVPSIPFSVNLKNSTLSLDLDVLTLTANVKDLRNGAVYTQQKKNISNLAVVKAVQSGQAVAIQAVNVKEKCMYDFDISLDSTSGDTVHYAIRSYSLGNKKTDVNFSGPLAFPQKNISKSDDYLVLPINEGVIFDSDDSGFPKGDWSTYSGHGFCMPFYGYASKSTGAGFINIIETPDDAGVRLSTGETNCAQTLWYSQKGKFGYERSVRQVFFTEGNHVSVAKEYRKYAKEKGLLVTFDEKKAIRGEKGAANIDKLLGAANIWNSYGEWSGHKLDELAKSIKDAGIDRILWSERQSAGVVNALNDMGILTGAYDIYQDIMDPAKYSLIKNAHGLWIPEAYPKDINVNEDGSFTKAWGVESKDGSGLVYTNALCDMTAPGYARKRISEEMSTLNLGARFFDTTTASSLRQCYSKTHPMTRTQSREKRYELLSIASNEYGLVCGSETGMDFCVPVCDYFEGMLSLGPWRKTDSGRNCSKLYDEAEQQIYDYQLNEARRIPLWELVYHDCCVAMWYWDDCNNKFSSVWDKRDLFNALYGVPPMYWINSPEYLAKNKTQLVKSYNTSAKIVRKTAGVEMTSHRFVTADRSVQEVKYANGVTVKVNFTTGKVTTSGI